MHFRNKQIKPQACMTVQLLTNVLCVQQKKATKLWTEKW